MTIKPCIRNAVLAAAVFVAAVLPFVQSSGYGLVNCDDYAYVTTPKAVRAGVTADSLGWAFTDKSEGIWMPLTWFSYMLDYSLFKGDFGAMHIHSLLIHGLNSVLVFLLLIQLFGRTEDESSNSRNKNHLALVLVSLFWAVHPLRCESVVWVASRKDVISFFWMLLALICWIGWRRDQRHYTRYIVSLLCFAVGAMAKPSVMVFPVLALLLDWFLLKREKHSFVQFIKMLFPLLPPFAGAFALGLFAQWMQSAGGCTVELQNMPFWGRLLNALVSFGLYLKNTVIPFDLAPQCMMRWPHPPRLMGVGLVITAFVLWWITRHLKADLNQIRALLKSESESAAQTVQGTHSALESSILAGALWYALSIVPFLGLSAFGYHSLADRFTYIPAVGFCLILAGCWSHAIERKNQMQFLCVGVLVCLLLSARAWDQTKIWQNDLTMWKQTIRVDGESNGVATAGLGLYLYEFDHDSPATIENFDKSFNVCPDFMQKTGFIYINHLCERGQLDKAADRLKWYSDWSQQMRDAERAALHIDDIVEMKPMIQYRFARVGYFIHKPELRSIGENELAEIKVLRPNDIHVLYLEGRLAQLKGDTKGAVKIWTKLRQSGQRRDYVQYRFLDQEIAKLKGSAE